MPIKIELNKNAKNGVKPVKIFTSDVGNLALTQLKNLSKLPFIHSHIAAMPDVHAGIGATVGSVIPTDSAIIPAAVGVDIGCGMNAVRLSLKAYQLPDNLKPLRLAIEKAVPLGSSAHKMISVRTQSTEPLEKGIEEMFKKHPQLLKMMKKPHQTWAQQMGTLGSGNHFIELCIDENQDVWVMLHSGSRGIGNALGRYFIRKAKKDMQGHMHNLPDRDLSYFSEGCENFDDYLQAVKWAQDYAFYNRKEMMGIVTKVIKSFLPPFQMTREAINCHHNYVSREEHYGKHVYVTRKGAISAQQDELGIIPGSMGTKSYIVKGKGKKESFCSCAHGAGRSMTRTAAKKRFRREDMEQQTRGVECRKDSGVIDEIPAAYKDIDQVMENQSDLIEVVHQLKQVVCVKG